MKRHTALLPLLLLPALAAGPYRAVLNGRTLEILAGPAVVRQAHIGADLPESEQSLLRRGIWTVNDAGLTALLEDYVR